MTIDNFLDTLPAERKGLLSAMHKIISVNDPKVTFSIKPMMGKEMIFYEEDNYMKYALASTKNYMSLHAMPLYMNPSLHEKYSGLLPQAKFQKGCINFMAESEMPLSTFKALIADCEPVNVPAISANRKKKKS